MKFRLTVTLDFLTASENFDEMYQRVERMQECSNYGRKELEKIIEVSDIEFTSLEEV